MANITAWQIIDLNISSFVSLLTLELEYSIGLPAWSSKISVERNADAMHKWMINPETTHDDVIKWKHFPRYWPFVRGIYRSPVNSPHKGQWRRALMFTLICVWINGCVNNREAGDLRRYCAHNGVTVMWVIFFFQNLALSSNVVHIKCIILSETGHIGCIFGQHCDTDDWCLDTRTSLTHLPLMPHICVG